MSGYSPGTITEISGGFQPKITTSTNLVNFLAAAAKKRG
jgi:hypothetical protein